MKRQTELAGHRFGRWTVLGPSNNTERRMWRCRCDCGTNRDVRQDSLISGKSVSCGCTAVRVFRPERRHDLTGQRFGRLIALRPGEKIGSRTAWECRCDCGNTITVETTQLRAGRTRSCGCLQAEVRGINEPMQQGLDEYVDDNFSAETHASYIAKSTARTDSQTGIRGVSPYKGRYTARIKFRKKTYSLGYFNSLADAAAMRRAAETLLYGSYLEDGIINEYADSAELQEACLNLINPPPTTP